MIRRWLAGVTIGVALLGPSTVHACTLMMAGPKEELRFQQRLSATSETIFLGRATPVGLEESSIVPMVSIEGARPPQITHVGVVTNCGEEPPQGAVIVFARRIRRDEMPLRPWRWGSWYVASYLQPHEVVDPELARKLTEAVARLDAER